MIITCITCRYLPNLRFVARLCEVDRAVILDLAPLPHQNKNSFISRNRICDSAGNKFWLSVPVRRKGISDIAHAATDMTQHNWIDKHIKNIVRIYPNHRAIAGDFLEKLEESLRQSDGRLININMRSLSVILRTLELDNLNISMQSDIVSSHIKDHRLDIARLLNAGKYVAGRVEWDVMQKSGCLSKMTAAGINVFITPELDNSVFPVELIEKCSSIHSILTRGPEKTRELVDVLSAHLSGNNDNLQQ